ncbi:hypothetical protein GCM10018789_21760 [Streptomyces werraensis]|nr:hypothetical protein GCM10018789_21760 [Streptomyces werraensis]
MSAFGRGPVGSERAAPAPVGGCMGASGRGTRAGTVTVGVGADGGGDGAPGSRAPSFYAAS